MIPFHLLANLLLYAFHDLLAAALCVVVAAFALLADGIAAGQHAAEGDLPSLLLAAELVKRLTQIPGIGTHAIDLLLHISGSLIQPLIVKILQRLTVLRQLLHQEVVIKFKCSRFRHNICSFRMSE